MPLTIREAFEIRLTLWGIDAFHLACDSTRSIQVMIHDIAHQPDVHQVDRIAQCLAHREDFMVILGLEIGKGVQATPREKTLRRAGGIAPLQGILQQLLQARLWGGLQARDDPL